MIPDTVTAGLNENAGRMRSVFHRIRNLAMLAKRLQWKEIAQKIGNRLYSSTLYYGLVQGLANPADGATVASAIPTGLRLMRPGDARVLFDIHAPGLSHEDISDRLYGHLLLNAGIRTSYVAVAADDRPRAALWLISAADNVKLRNISNSSFPLLARDEMLLEGLFTLNADRNLHIMASSIVQALSIAKAAGAAKVIAFVHQKNVASLRTLVRSGFSRYVVKRDSWLLFFRNMTFDALPEPADTGPGGKGQGPSRILSGVVAIR